MADLNDGRLDLPRSRPRFVAFGVAAVLVFAVLGGRLFQLQVVGADPAGRSTPRGTIERAIPAPRGLIFDRAGRPVAVNVPSWTVKIRPADLPDARRSRVLRQVAEAIGADVGPMRQRLDAYNGSPYDLIPVARGVSRAAALILAERSPSLPGVVVAAEPIRRYLDEAGKPNGGLLAHVLGYTGPVAAGELDELEARGYLRDDVIGRAGVEAAFEDELRGEYGSEVVERDANGRGPSCLDGSEDGGLALCGAG